MLWRPSIILSNVYRETFSPEKIGRTVNLTTHPPLLPKLRKGGTILPPPVMLLWCAHGRTSVLLLPISWSEHGFLSWVRWLCSPKFFLRLFLHLFFLWTFSGFDNKRYRFPVVLMTILLQLVWFSSHNLNLWSVLHEFKLQYERFHKCSY
jgi:hypothetical protein